MTVSFEDLFLGTLFGVNRRKANSTFATLGQYIWERLRNDGCISMITAPKAALGIKLNPSSTGWTLLEQLLTKRLVLCIVLPNNKGAKLMNDFEL